jgi:hypothetical protein
LANFPFADRVGLLGGSLTLSEELLDDLRLCPLLPLRLWLNLTPRAMSSRGVDHALKV